MSPDPAFPGGRDAVRGPATVRFWGVRGSIPVPGPQTAGFGGNTSCVELRAGGQIIILDAGTGLRALGSSLIEEFRGQPLSLTMLITHTHSDHTQGFPFFAPAYEASNRIRILGFSEGGCGLQKAFARQMEPAYFPVGLSHMQAEILFEELGGDAFQLGSICVSTCRTSHPGFCGAYRITTGAGSICYIPDHEANGNGEPGCAAVPQLIREADLVILDSQYTAEEYRGREGWGHSSMEHAVRTACDARAKCLRLFHHDPSHSDDFLEQMLHQARRIAAGSETRIEAAREGDVVTLAGSV